MMKKNMKKKIGDFLKSAVAGPLTACCFAACNGDNSSSVKTTEVDKGNSMVLVENGKPLVRVKHGELAGDKVKAAAEAVKNALQDLCPEDTVEITTDIDVKEKGEPSSAEIVIGKTELPESFEVLNGILYGEYAMAMKANKLVITAWSDDAVDLAVNAFISLMEKAAAEKVTVKIGTEDCFVRTYSKWLNMIKVMPGTVPAAITDCGNNCYQVLTDNASEESYNTYLSLLQNEYGYRLDSERCVSNNKFATLNGNGCSVSLSYTPVLSSMQIIAEPVENRYMAEKTVFSQFDAITTPKMTMIGRKFGNGTDDPAKIDASCGLMSFVIRLSNGHFIVIDGGVATEPFAAGIYDSIKSQAPDPDDLVIDAWILTHIHIDHIGGFLTFSELYSKSVKINGLFLNFPSSSDIEHMNETYQEKRFDSHIKEYYPQVPVYKVHTGQVNTFADAEIEYYFAPEDYITKDRDWKGTKNVNLTSLVLTVKLAGQNILFMGDCAAKSDAVVAQKFGKYMKCDIMQVSHHGGPGSGTDVYRNADPAVALFSTSDPLLPVYLGRYESNIVLMNELHVKHTFNAADRITVWDLPMKLD